jgi:hypothetical protein
MKINCPNLLNYSIYDKMLLRLFNYKKIIFPMIYKNKRLSKKKYVNGVATPGVAHVDLS